MIFNVTFFNPLLISPLIVQDYFKIIFNGSQNLLNIQPKYMPQSIPDLTRTISIRKQLLNSDMKFASYTDIGVKYFMYIMIFGILFMILSLGSKDYILILIRSLALVIHLPIFKIVFPGNTILFTQLSLNIVQFDVISYFWQWNQYDLWAFNLNINPPVGDQQQDISFNDRNSFSALGTLSLLILLYFLFVFVLLA